MAPPFSGTCKHLIFGIGMNGSHQALVDTHRFMQSLGHWRQAVGGAGGIGNDLVRGLQHAFGDTKHHGGVDIGTTGSRDDDLLCTCSQVHAGLFPILEQTGTLQHNVDTQITPG